MKLVTLVASMLLLAGATSAHAAINGAWQGTFNTMGSDGTDDVTPGFQLGVSMQGNSVTFSEPMGLTMLDGVTATINGTSLVYNDHTIGSINGNDMTLTFIDDIDNVFDTVNISMNQDGSLNYQDYMADYTGDYLNSTAINFPAASINTSKKVARGSALETLFAGLKKK